MKWLPASLALVTPLCFAATGVSVDGLIQSIIYLVVIGLIFWALWWFIGYVGLPEPFNKIARVVIGLIALIVVINFLLSFAGHPLVTFR